MRYLFTGDVPLTYSQYRDLENDTVLTARPGESYWIEPAGGISLPVPPEDGRWLEMGAFVPAPPAATADTPPVMSAPLAADSEPEPGPEPDAEPDSTTEDGEG